MNNSTELVDESLKKFEILFSKYLNKNNKDKWITDTVMARDKDHAIKKLKRKHYNKKDKHFPNGRRVNYIISITEL